MFSRPKINAVSSPLVPLLSLWALLACGEACTATATASPPPPAGGATCAPDGTVACTDGQGFSCTGSDAPRDSNQSLLCDEGAAGNAGSTIYCCLTASLDTTCGDDPTVSCPGGGFGFSCANAAEEPNKAYPSLNCSVPTPGNAGSETYCCTD